MTLSIEAQPERATVDQAVVKPPDPEPADPLPQWYAALVGLLVASVASVGAAGLVLAILGLFQPVAVAAASAVVLVVLLTLWQPWRHRGSGSVAALLVLGLVVGVTVWNGANVSEHLVTDRDPGVYVTAGRWLARDGGLTVDPGVGPYRDDSGLRFEEQGWNLDDDDRLSPQFLHLLPVLLAVGQWLGGDQGLLLVPALLGGLALLAFYALATRAVPRWWAVAATAALAFDLVQVNASRDAYSELAAQVLLFAGLALLWSASRTFDARRAAAAGLLVGAVSMARVEGVVQLIPLVTWAALEVGFARSRPRKDRRHAVRFVRSFLGGLALTTALGVVDVVVRGQWYLEHLAATLLPAAAGLVVVAVATRLAVVAGPRLRLGQRLDRHRFRLGAAAAVAVVLVFAFGWFVRPSVQEVAGSWNAAVADLQRQNHLPVDGRRHYAEDSLRWIAWYVGPVTLAAGIAGLALAARGVVSDCRRWLAALPALGVFLAVSLIYLWRPSITPDHIWVMRRFLPVTIPGIVLLAVWTAHRGWVAVGDGRPAWRWLGRAAAVAVALAGVGHAAVSVAPVADATAYRGLDDGIGRVCDAVGDDGAVLVIPGSAVEIILPQAIRSFCGVPVASARATITPERVFELAGQWREAGRRLHVIGYATTAVEPFTGARATVVRVPNDEVLESTLVERPDETTRRPVTIVVAPVVS